MFFSLSLSLFSLRLFHSPTPLTSSLPQAELQKLKEARAKHTDSGFFSDDDFEGLFSLHDPAKTGRLTADVAAKALSSLGLSDPVDVPADGVDLAQFKGVARKAVAAQKAL